MSLAVASKAFIEVCESNCKSSTTFVSRLRLPWNCAAKLGLQVLLEDRFLGEQSAPEMLWILVNGQPRFMFSDEVCAIFHELLGHLPDIFC